MKFGGFVYMKTKLKPKVKPGFNETGNVSFDDIDSFFNNLNTSFSIPDSALKYNTGKQNDVVQVIDLNKTNNKETLF